MDKNSKFSETGCYVCATKSHFRIMNYLGFFPIKLECHHQKPSHRTETFSIRNDKTGFIICLAHIGFTTLFLIQSMLKLIKVARNSPDVVIIIESLCSVMHLMALMCVMFVLNETSSRKLEIQGFAKIYEAYSSLRPMFTKLTEEQLNYDTFIFILFILGCLVSNYIEIFYNLVNGLKVTVDDCYDNFALTWSTTIVCSKFYMFISTVNLYGYFLDEHHAYVRNYILEPKRRQKMVDKSIATLSDYVGDQEVATRGPILVDSVKSVYDIRLKMIQIRKSYSAIYFNFVFMNDYYNPTIFIALSGTVLYGIASVFAFCGILMDGFMVDFFMTKIISFFILTAFVIYIIFCVSDVYFKVNYILQ